MPRSVLVILAHVLIGGAVLPAQSEETDRGPGDVRAAESEHSPVSLDQLVQGLENPDFQVRRQASRALVESGAAAIPTLLSAINSGSLELGTRALAVIEESYVSLHEAAVDAADRALEQLSRSENRAIALRAGAILSRHEAVYKAVALRRIRSLGGRVREDVATVPNVRGFDPVKNTQRYITLGPDWRGGNQGLEYVKRFAGGYNGTGYLVSHVYLIKGVPLTDDAVRELEVAFGRGQVQWRGQVFLGIKGHAADPRPGCWVTDVIKGMSADRAGLIANDRILKFDGTEVENFDHLIELIKTKSVGDEVEAEIQRNTELITKSIKLGDWTPPRTAK